MITLGVALGVAGFILTLGFGGYGIWEKRKSQKKVSLGFEKKECYSLFKKDIDRLNIEINYQGKTLDSYLILFKGTICNNGNSDIDKTRIHNPLLIKTNDEYKWLEANVSDIPDGAIVALTKIDDTSLKLDWDLLKKDEQIEFEALIEIPQNKEIEEITESFYNSITFDFRITDVNKIEKLSDINPMEKTELRKRKANIFLGCLFFIVGMILFFTPEFSDKILLFRKQNIEFELISTKGTNYSVISVLRNDKLELDIEGNEQKLAIVDFNKDYRINKIAGIKKDEGFIYLFRIGGGVYIFFGLTVFYLCFFSKKREYIF
jgi:hypothetical protein